MLYLSVLVSATIFFSQQQQQQQQHHYHVSSFGTTTTTTIRTIRTMPMVEGMRKKTNPSNNKLAVISFPLSDDLSLVPLTKATATATTTLTMIKGNNDEDTNNGGVGLIAGVLFAVFIAGSVLPLVGTFDMKGQGGVSLADSVITRQDVPGKLNEMGERKEFKLSRSNIQDKLNAVPVFYLVDTTTATRTTTPVMSSEIYVSYEDALGAASSSNSNTVVKGTTLDQVMYPLVLKRGRMRMAPPPLEIEEAEAQVLAAAKNGDTNSNSNSNNNVLPTYRLIPSSKAVQQYKKSTNNEGLTTSDVPLFVADRLAFGSSEGPQLPLFLNEDDCIASYQRLQQGSNGKLPVEPTIRTSSLLQTVLSMEKGTRPGLKQLAFYATEQDLNKVVELRFLK